ncbi:hypothetical protein JYU34_017735 [Plutella xylostella]|uniref:Uncharacterized protein n=1 Tax=Plutella xylostella TaxID=51655 RepID=A0ABQ7Q1Z3_PLUXY|nr:hypothetical protein JYU34_017735 [Plutella xylostella]
MYDDGERGDSRKTTTRTTRTGAAAAATAGCSANMMNYAEELVPKFSGQDRMYVASRWVEDNSEEVSMVRNDRV